MTKVIEKAEGQRIEPASRLGEVARIYGCEVYLNYPRMDTCNFVLNGKEYLSAKSVIFPSKLEFQIEDRVEFIVMGARRLEIMDVLQALLDR